MKVLGVVLSSLLSFAALFGLTKLIGCRQVSQLSLFDYINGITIGSAATELAIAPPGERMAPLTAMVVYAGATFLLSILTNRSLALRRVVEGTPVFLLRGDRLLEENFRAARIDLCEFLMQARLAGYFDLSQIEAAILEPNGMLSFLPKSEHRPAAPADFSIPVQKEEAALAIILDGEVQQPVLHRLGFDETWLRDRLHPKKPQEIFLALCMPDGSLTVYPREKK